VPIGSRPPQALARRKWEDVARNESFEWKTKRSPRRLSHFRGLSPMVGESISLNLWAIRDAGYLFGPVALVSKLFKWSCNGMDAAIVFG
jgi:hypothetical protein